MQIKFSVLIHVVYLKGRNTAVSARQIGKAVAQSTGQTH